MRAINNAWQNRWGWPRYDHLKDLEHDMSQKESNWLVIKERDEFIGGVFYITHDHTYPDKVYFGSLWTAPHTGQTGLGSLLITYIEYKAKQQGKNGTHIVVNPKLKRLIGFYEKRGYVLLNESQQFPGFMRMEKSWGYPEESGLPQLDNKACSSA